ncbi:inositol monophosphatase family protein [Stigmatella aurantiaca]|uniref:Inositol-1-monophosphatase n=1 Tax=Stigmatella aurantiaca (strain DW4/3-1) TaxID=378806 RepID=Q095D4_STIAD|nr:inositol monophosphatase family protein [Stigmatella aurantiaca]ADO70483.1 Inositol-1-monophosphatase [Stigmatella aurantiaca DW4/3-1]EAU67328.1 inositol-1-monophosphatase [Stigmatella aurantiaca DW4/3-1]
MEQETPAALRRIAEEAARLGGRILAERFLGERIIELKGSTSNLVTDADKASEEALLAFLRARYPRHAILAEESGVSQGTGLRWLIDPLDGTTNYAHRVPHFCVSLAVEGPQGVLAGVVYDPMLDELFSAARGEGATLNGRPLRASETTEMERALLCTGFPYDVRERPEGPVGLFSRIVRRAQGIRRTGSAALDLAYVAAGRFDGFFEFGLKPWDIGAGSLLVQEAGGRMAQIDGLPFDVMRGDVLASAPGLAVELQEECLLFLQELGRVPRA